MVQDGRLSPDDACELMSAFINFDGEPEPTNAGKQDAQTEAPSDDAGDPKGRVDPMRRLMDSIEKMTKEGVDSVDWKEVAASVKSAAMRGVDTLRTSVEQISKGEFKVFWAGLDHEATVGLPLHIESGKTLRLDWKSGDIEIHGGHEIGSLTATAKLTAKSKEEAAQKAEHWTPVIEEHEGSVTLRQSPDATVEDLVLKVPAGIAIDIRTESGDIATTGTAGSLRVSALSGNVSASGLSGQVEVNTASSKVTIADVENGNLEIEVKSGDVHMTNVRGNIKVRSASGRISGKELAGRSISIETVNGEVDLDVSEPLDGALSVRTVNGDVVVDLAGGSNCRVALSSLSGEARCNFELDDEKRTKDRITGKIGDGSGTLDVSAVKGDVSLGLRDHYR